MLRRVVRFVEGALQIQRAPINTVRYIVKGLPEYPIDVDEIDRRIVDAAHRCNQQQGDNPPLYYVKRTSLAKMLPVYVAHRYDRAHPRTQLRRIDGSLQALADELALFIPLEKIFIRPLNASIRVKGNYGDSIRQFLTLRGF